MAVASAGQSLLLKRAAASRLSGEWNDNDFDVLADGVVPHLQGERSAGRNALVMDTGPVMSNGPRLAA